METLKIKLAAKPTLLHPGADVAALNRRINCHIEITDVPAAVTAAEALRVVERALIFNPPEKITFSELKEKTEKGALITK